MKTLNTLIAVAALSVVSTATFAADDSPAAQRVQQSISQQVVDGNAQQAATAQSSFVETGMSVAAGRVQQSISADRIQGDSRVVIADSQDFQNDAGKSVSATRFQNALSDSNV